MSAARAFSRRCAAVHITRAPKQHLAPPACLTQLPTLRPAPCPHRAELLVAAAHSKSARKRVRTNERNRLFNMFYRERAKAAIRKAYRGYEELLSPVAEVKSESELESVDKLQGLAFAAIDKARVKGVFHKSTASRRKAKVSRIRKKVLMRHELYTPPDLPPFDPKTVTPDRPIKQSAAARLREKRVLAARAAAKESAQQDTPKQESAAEDASLPSPPTADTSAQV